MLRSLSGTTASSMLENEMEGLARFLMSVARGEMRPLCLLCAWILFWFLLI